MRDNGSFLSRALADLDVSGLVLQSSYREIKR